MVPGNPKPVRGYNVVTFFNTGRSMTKTEPSSRMQKKPFISVVVPAYNEERFLSACLASLKAQDYAGGYEIIVVDNASTDRTAEIASNLGARVVIEKRRSPAWARQRGLFEARGEIVAFVDADTIVPRRWLSTIAWRFGRTSRLVAVSGPCAYFDGGVLARIASTIMNFIVIIFDHTLRRLTKKGGALWGSNFAVRREILLEVGGFDTGKKFLGEDIELSLRLKTRGKMSLISYLFVLTSARRLKALGTWNAFWNYVVSYFLELLFRRPLPERLADLPGKLNKIVRTKLHLVLKWGNGVGYVVVIISLISILVWLNNKSPVSQNYKLFYSSLVAFVYLGTRVWVRHFRRVIAHGDRRYRQIALTFDDGPNEPFTSQVLDILGQYDVKATFLVIGQNVERWPNVTQKIVKEGHTIGNHSYFHSPWLALRKGEEIVRELKLAQETICRVSGVSPKLFRPPYGFWTPWLLKASEGNGLSVITWDNMTSDWNSRWRVEQIARAILRKAKPGGIIVLHDGRGIRQNFSPNSLVGALPIILAGLKRQGYQFVTVPELLNQRQG